MSRSLLRVTLAGLALTVGLATAAPARAALLWTLTASPLTVTTGSTTTFSLAATNLDVTTPIRCIEVDVPRIFEVKSATGGPGWTASIAGSSGNRVRVTSADGIGGGLLRPLSTTFTIRARALAPGELSWPADAYARQDCGGSGSVLGVPPVVLVLGPAATPTPTPTASPTPKPTPTASPTPTPKPTPASTPKPTPTPTRTPTPTPTPIIGLPPPPSIDPLPSVPVVPDLGLLPTPSPTPRPAPEASLTPGPGDPDASGQPVAPEEPSTSEDAGPPPASAAPTTAGDDEPSGSGGPPSDPDAGAGGGVAGPVTVDAAPGEPGPPTFVGRLPAEQSAVPVSLGALGIIGAIDTWIIPSALFGIPGVALIVVVLLQTGAAAAWLPAIRRLRGDEQPAAVT